MHDTSLSKCNVTINVLANATIVLITTSISKLIYIFRPMEMKQRGGVSSGMQLGRFQFYIQVTQVTTTTDNNLQLYKVSTTTKQKQNNSKKQTDRQTDRQRDFHFALCIDLGIRPHRKQSRSSAAFLSPDHG